MKYRWWMKSRPQSDSQHFITLCAVLQDQWQSWWDWTLLNLSPTPSVNKTKSAPWLTDWPETFKFVSGQCPASISILYTSPGHRIGTVTDLSSSGKSQCQGCIIDSYPHLNRWQSRDYHPDSNCSPSSTTWSPRPNHFEPLHKHTHAQTQSLKPNQTMPRWIPKTIFRSTPSSTHSQPLINRLPNRTSTTNILSQSKSIYSLHNPIDIDSWCNIFSRSSNLHSRTHISDFNPQEHLFTLQTYLFTLH